MVNFVILVLLILDILFYMYFQIFLALYDTFQGLFYVLTCLALSGDAFSNMCNSFLRQNYHYIKQYFIYFQMDIAQDLILYKRILSGSSFNANKTYKTKHNFLNFYLAAPRPTLGHYQRNILIDLILSTAFLQL